MAIYDLKPLPVGIDDFKTLIQDYYFVDKTSFIDELLSSKTQVSLITRPRRFGKTLILSMLEYFFTLENASENRQLFSSLAIEESNSKYLSRQGKSPVIFISLKDIRQDNFDDFIYDISTLMSDVYDKYSYILDSNKLSEINKITYNNILFKRANKIDLEYSLKNITKFLFSFYNKKIILLIDEYDAPIINAWKNNYYDQCINFMRKFLSEALKTNKQLDIAVLTGITRISKESIFSGLNNFSVRSILSNKFDNIFGFTKIEINKMLKYYNIANKIDEIKDWYDGYKFGQSEIYNPWSIINYIDNQCEPRSYWINSSENIIINNLLDSSSPYITKDIELLINGKSITKYIDDNFVFNEINNIDALYSILLVSGYLKVVQKELVDNQYLCKLTIPNKEVLNEYRFRIYNHIFGHKNNINFDLNNMLQAMLCGQAEIFEELLKEFILEVISYLDLSKNKQEEFYHGLVLGLIATITNDYILDSNKESGLGRFDIVCIPKDHTKFGVILEFKSSISEHNLVKDVDLALSQIDNKKYDAVFKKYNINNVLKYGLAFHKKSLLIKCKR